MYHLFGRLEMGYRTIDEGITYRSIDTIDMHSKYTFCMNENEDNDDEDDDDDNDVDDDDEDNDDEGGRFR